MFIESISIKSFGRLSDYSVTLSPGLNVFEGNNESGKSTIAEFIKFMLYGMQSKAVGDRELSERKKYISWDTAVASGSMTVNYGGKRILIERSITASTDSAGTMSYRESLRMTDSETGAQLYKGKNPGDVLLGVPEEIFTGTAFIRQLGGTRIDGGKLSSSAENLLFSADEAISTEKSIERLDTVRRQLLYKNGRGGSLYEKERKREEISGKLETAKRVAGELIAVENSISELSDNRAMAEKKRDESRKKNENYEAVKKLHSFDKLHGIENELEELFAEREKLLADELVGDHFPDEEYVGKLREVSDGISVTSTLITSLSRRIDEIRRERGSEEAIARRKTLLERDDAIDSILATAKKKQKKKRMFGTTSIMLMVLTLMFVSIVGLTMASGVSDSFSALIGVSAEKIYRILVMLGSLGALLCVIPAVITFIISAATRREIENYATYYGAESIEELPIMLEELYEEAKRDLELERELETLESELHDKYVAYDEEIVRARGLILCRGVEAEGEEVPEKLRDVLLSSEEICARERILSEKTKEKRSAKDDLAGQLVGADEAVVRERTSSLDIAEYDAMSQSSLRLERDFNENAVTRLTETIHELEVKRVQLLSMREDPSELAVKLEALTAEMKKERERYDACVLAMDTLARAGESVRESVVPRIRELARNYLSGITDGKYDRIGVDGEFSMTVDADGAFRELEYMSEGTSDAAYLSLRLALIKLLYKKTLPPLIFDEAFARMDDERASSVMSILAQGDEGEIPQAILFTCQRREGKLLESMPVEECKIVRLSADM